MSEHAPGSSQERFTAPGFDVNATGEINYAEHAKADTRRIEAERKAAAEAEPQHPEAERREVGSRALSSIGVNRVSLKPSQEMIDRYKDLGPQTPPVGYSVAERVALHHEHMQHYSNTSPAPASYEPSFGLGNLPPKQNVDHLAPRTPSQRFASMEGFVGRPLPPHLQRRV